MNSSQDRPGENQVAASGPAVASHGGPIELTSFNIRSDPSPSGDSLGERGTSWASGPVIRSLVLRLSRHGKYEALKQPLLFFSSAATLYMYIDRSFCLFVCLSVCVFVL